MKKVAFLSIPFFLLTILLLSPQPHAEAGGGWIQNSTHAPYRIDNACTDGVQVTVVVDEDNIPGGQFGDNGGNMVNLQPVYLFEGDYLAEKTNDPTNIFLNREYIQTLYPARQFVLSITEQQPEPVDYKGESFLYETVVLPFYTPAPVGSSVLLNNSSGQPFFDDNIAAVGDCRFFSYSAAESANIPAAQIAAISTNFDPAQMVFTVKSVPPTGDVTLNGGSPLAINDTFILKAILDGSGQLDYTPTAAGPGFANGTLTVAVHGIMRVVPEWGELNGDSLRPSVSANGQKVAFQSNSTNTVPGIVPGTFLDTLGWNHVYQAKMGDGIIDPISYSLPNGFGNSSSLRPDISPDGSGVAFVSSADNLLNGSGQYCFGDHPNWQDTNNGQDVYLAHENSIFRPSMFRWDDPNQGSECEQINSTFDPAAADMRARREPDLRRKQVVFVTYEPINAPDYLDENSSSDLVLFADTHTEWITGISQGGIIIQPREMTQAVKNAPDGGSSRPDISADSYTIVFQSTATDLVKSLGGFNLDTNNKQDIFASRWNGTRWSTKRVSVNSTNQQGDDHSWEPAVSQNGDHVVFLSSATNFAREANGDHAQVFVRDQLASCTTLISANSQGLAGDNASSETSISGDGRFVAFLSYADNLVKGDTDHLDVFVVDRDADGDGLFYTDKACTPGKTSIRRVSVTADGSQANDRSNSAQISLNGEFVVFDSDASNLVPNDTNDKSDIFVAFLGYERTISFTGIDEKQVFLPLMISE